MSSNFGWDFIYRGAVNLFIALDQRLFQSVRSSISAPFHEPMSAFPVITEGLTGGSPATKRTRRALWG